MVSCIFALLAQTFYFLVFQFFKGHLAHQGGGKGFSEFNVSGAAPFDQRFAAVGDDILLHIPICQGSFLEYHKGLDPLNLFFVGYAYDTGLCHTGVLVQDILHLGRVNIHARGFDHPLSGAV